MIGIFGSAGSFLAPRGAGEAPEVGIAVVGKSLASLGDVPVRPGEVSCMGCTDYVLGIVRVVGHIATGRRHCARDFLGVGAARARGFPPPWREAPFQVGWQAHCVSKA